MSDKTLPNKPLVPTAHSLSRVGSRSASAAAAAHRQRSASGNRSGAIASAGHRKYGAWRIAPPQIHAEMSGCLLSMTPK
jgi:hypothetical protein